MPGCLGEKISEIRPNLFHKGLMHWWPVNRLDLSHLTK